MGDQPELLEVRGGSAGIAASYAAARELADRFDAAGDLLRDWGRDGLRVMRDPDLLESGVLAPESCALAEAAVLGATGGPDGMVAASLGWEVDAVAVRAAIDGLEVADEAVRASIHDLDRLLLPILVPTALNDVAHGGVGELTHHPGLVEHIVDGLGGSATAAAITPLLYLGPGHPEVAPYSAQLTPDQPQTVRGLMDHLHDVAGLSHGPASPANGTIEVQTITAPDGSVRHILYLPGTDHFNAPWDQGSDVRDLESGLDAIGQLPDSYEQGILQALHQAGVRPGEPLAVVGHSLGGMEAVSLLAHHHDFNITDVVTAGAPTAQVHGFPSGSHVLSLEQQGDVVPELDGAPNPDTVQQTTVIFDAHPDGGIHSHHLYDTYLAGASLVDSSADPSVVDCVQSLHEHGYLGSGNQVTSQVYQITRVP